MKCALRSASFVLLALTIVACQPDLGQLRNENAEQELQMMASRAMVVSEALTLDRAIELALQNNLDYAVSQLQASIANEAATGSYLSMMPSLNETLEWREMSEQRVVTSQSAITGAPSLVPSRSSDQREVTNGTELLFSVLDFGISFFRAREADNRARIAELEVTRTRQNLVLNVTRTYFRAVVADQAVTNTNALIGRLQERQAVIDRQMQQHTISEMEGLKNQEALALAQIRLQDFQRELSVAKTEMAAQLGLSPHSQISFAAVDFSAAGDQQTFDVAALESEALHGRPEMFQSDLQGLISEDEVRVAIAQLFPSPAGFLRYDWDSNQFLHQNSWWTVGARVSYNLFALPRHIAELGVANDNETLSGQRRLAVAMGIVVQLNLAVIGYQDAWQQYGLARNLQDVRDRKLTATRAAQQQGTMTEADVLEAESDALYARIRTMNAYADLKVAERRVANAAGR